MTTLHTTDATRLNSWMKQGYRIDDHEHVIKNTTNYQNITLTGDEADKKYGGENFPPHFYPQHYQKPDYIQQKYTLNNNVNSRDLSIRQAQVIHAILPKRNEPLDVPKSSKLLSQNHKTNQESVQQIFHQPIIQNVHQYSQQPSNQQKTHQSPQQITIQPIKTTIQQPIHQPIHQQINQPIHPNVTSSFQSPQQKYQNDLHHHQQHTISPTVRNSPPLDYVNFVNAKPKVITKYGDYPELQQGAVINFAPSSISPRLSANITVENSNHYQPSRWRQPQKIKSRFNDVDDELHHPLGPFGASYAVEDEQVQDEQPNVTMEAAVSGQSGQPKRVGRWTLAQLRQTDGIIPSQAGWNKGDSQRGMTGFGTARRETTKVTSENLQEIPEEISMRTHGEVRLQSGTNKFDSQKGMTGFGTGRREITKIKSENLAEVPEEKIRLSDGIVRLQSGTNKYDSQKGMTGFGTARRETTKMIDTKHPEYDHERPDQAEIPLQAGTNKFASQKGMTGFGTNRRETCKIVDNSHPEYDPETSIDSTSIPYQMGSNKYASQRGMTGFGQPRWEVLDPSISWQNRKSQGMVRLQSGTNRFASQSGMTGFGTIRNTTYVAEAGELPYEELKKSEAIIPSQAGWNRGDSQKGMTGFGAPRDVKGKHLKRIWEIEFPEEAEISLDRL